MKIKDGFILKEIAGKFIVVSVGNRVKEFNGIINLNETGVFLWKLLENGCDEQSMVNEFLSVYDVDENTAKTDVSEFVAKIKEANLLIEQ